MNNFKIYLNVVICQICFYFSVKSKDSYHKAQGTDGQTNGFHMSHKIT
jgi:hypothetical protein